MKITTLQVSETEVEAVTDNGYTLRIKTSAYLYDLEYLAKVEVEVISKGAFLVFRETLYQGDPHLPLVAKLHKRLTDKKFIEGDEASSREGTAFWNLIKPEE